MEGKKDRWASVVAQLETLHTAYVWVVVAMQQEANLLLVEKAVAEGVVADRHVVPLCSFGWVCDLASERVASPPWASTCCGVVWWVCTRLRNPS